MSQGPPAHDPSSSFWRGLWTGTQWMLSPLCDFLFPPTCLWCGQSLSVRDRSFCGACEQELRSPAGERCWRCAAPVGPHLNTSEGCYYCRDERFAFRRVVALGTYEGTLRKAILSGKSRQGAALVTALTDLLIDARLSDLLTEPFDAVVPVPHDWRRRFWGVHSPAETIGYRLARRLKRSYAPQLLRKPRPTPRQSLAVPSIRRRQQRGAFAAPVECDLTGLRLLLVDDVLTTGATAHAAARALRKRHAADVLVAVLARGVGHAR